MSFSDFSTIQVPDGDGLVSLRVSDSGGDGAPVVLIHPWPQRQEIWDRQHTALTGSGYRVVSYDRAGFGESEPSNGEVYSYDRLTQHLNGVMEALDLKDATLVGWSMGGGEVARYVGTHGTDRLRGIVLLAAIPPFLLRTEDNPEGPLTDEAWQEMNQAIIQDAAAVEAQVVEAFYTVDGKLLVDEATKAQAIEWAGTSDPTAVARCQEAFSTTDFRADLAKVDVPAAIIHGDSDSIVPLEYSGARAHAALPGSTLTVIEGAPHGLGVTHADQVDNALLAFLASTAPRD